jgi:hypothetical protein
MASGEYIISAPDVSLTNAHVVRRALGPDRVPVSPDPMDDEMIDATTGYDSSLWSVFNTSGETYSFDANGGLKISLVSTSQINGIEQAINGSVPWGFEAKFCLSATDSATNTHAGICIRDSTTGHIKTFGYGHSSGINWFGLNFTNPTSYSSTWLAGASEAIAAHGHDFIYLRVHGDGTNNTGFLASYNGVAWFDIAGLSNDGFVATQDRIAIFTYQDNAPSACFVAYFRRYL